MPRLPSRLIGVLTLLAAAALLLAACGSDDEQPASQTSQAPQPGATDTGCRKVAAPKPKGAQDLPKPTRRLQPGRTYVATVETSCGSFQITLDARRAPETGGSFASLVEKGFYDGLTFHRIVPQFVVQGGDPAGDGTGGPGYTVVEKPPASLQYTRGVVAMAKTQNDPAGASGSQFFVVTGEDAQLPPEYALLGKVTSGMDTVDRIEAVDANPTTGEPAQPVVIEKITLRER